MCKIKEAMHDSKVNLRSKFPLMASHPIALANPLACKIPMAFLYAGELVRVYIFILSAAISINSSDGFHLGNLALNEGVKAAKPFQLLAAQCL